MTTTPIYDQLRAEQRQHPWRVLSGEAQRFTDAVRRAVLHLVPPLPPVPEPHEVEARIRSDRASLDWHEQWRAER